MSGSLTSSYYYVLPPTVMIINLVAHQLWLRHRLPQLSPCLSSLVRCPVATPPALPRGYPSAVRLPVSAFQSPLSQTQRAKGHWSDGMFGMIEVRLPWIQSYLADARMRRSYSIVRQNTNSSQSYSVPCHTQYPVILSHTHVLDMGLAPA